MTQPTATRSKTPISHYNATSPIQIMQRSTQASLEAPDNAAAHTIEPTKQKASITRRNRKQTGITCSTGRSCNVVKAAYD